MPLYSALLGLGLIVSAPWWLLRMATTQRYREGLRERLGRVPQSLKAVAGGKRLIWVHAVSVGEVLAVSRLVHDLEAALNQHSAEPWTIVLSTTTRTGQALARERFGPDRVFYFPLDLAFAVRAYLRVLKPALVILAESELWPRLLHECARASVPVAVVNARLSDRSFRRAHGLRKLWSPVLRKVTLWLAQSQGDADRLLALGVPATTVYVSGNLKYDVRAPKETRIATLIQDVAAGRPILVAGSTVPGEPADEDQLLIQAWQGALRQDHRVFLVLAPRHPERFAAVRTLAAAFPSITATALLNAPTATNNPPSLLTPHPSLVPLHSNPPDILVLDTIGDLASVYSLATVAFVGGSLVPRGGHNPLEPAQFGVPVVMGGHYNNFCAVVDRMLRSNAIVLVRLSNTPSDLHHALQSQLQSLFQNQEMAQAIGKRGREVFEQEGGATARSIQALMPLIPRNPALAHEAISA